MKFKSIRQQLLLTSTLFITVLMCVIATGTYLYFREVSREMVFNQQFKMVTSVARDLDIDFEQAQNALIVVANSIGATQLKDATTAQAFLQSRVVIHTFFSTSLFILDKNGDMLAAFPARPNDYGTSFASRDYFKNTMSRGTAFISEPLLGKETKKPVIIMTAPIRATDGSITGVLCGRIDLHGKNNVISQLRDIKFGSNGYLYLFAPDRTLIMHPDVSRIMKRDVPPGKNMLFDRALEGFEGSGETVNSKGLHVLTSFKRLQTNNWILAVAYPKEEAYRPITRFRNFYLIGMVIALLGAMILVRWRALGISRPLTIFTDNILELSRPDSDMTRRLDIDRSDELGVLAVSFNALLDKVQKREEDRKLVEYELLKREHKISQLLQTTDQGIYGTDEVGCFTFINRSGLEILGYRGEDLVGGDSHSLIHHSYSDGSPYPVEECPIYLANAARINSKSDNELFWRKDGTPFVAEFSSYPIINDDIFSGAVVTFSDITVRKEAADKLRKLSRAVEQCPVSIVITDTDGLIEYVNPHFTELTGYALEEAIGKNPRILNSGKTASELFESLWTTITSGKTWEGDMLNKSKDGSLFWEHTSISALRDDNGIITHYLAIKEDVTEKKAITEQLIIAKEQAEAANVAKSSFLATMSHEIRTPMNGVIGMTSLLLDTELSEEQREYGVIVRRSGESLLSLINDILDFSKIEAGKLDLEILDFDLRVTLEDTSELLALRASDAGLELICHIDPAVPSYLKGDPGRIRQVITNLAGNAIKFTHQGEVVISAKLASEQGDCTTVLFEITDTGIGMPESRLTAVFEPFTQVDGSTTRKYGGTGLGLAICKQLVGLMGGEIGVTSQEGSGSTFWFTAPFKKQSGILLAPDVVQYADITGSKILVVDDNATNRKLMKILLDHWGCRNEDASGGESALALLREAADRGEPFQIALLDHEMPGMDGLELGRRIKADPLLESTLLVMVTSLGQRGDAAVLEQIGFSGYLAKPVRQSLLHDCIALVLGRAHQASEILPQPQSIITKYTVSEVETQSVHILLAEDNIINQKVAQQMLKKLGYRADVVADGSEAVRALEMIRYDLVLMDCQMPNMNGFEATAMIRNAGSKVLNHSVPIIAMTANAMQGDREDCITAGMNDYLSKPVKKDELAEILGKWLQTKPL